MDRTQIAVVGAGLVGAAIAYDLTTHGIQTIVLEAASDVGAGASRSNSGVVHTGFDSTPGTLETAMIRAQGERWQQVFTTIGVPYRVPGALLVATDREQAHQLPVIAAQAQLNGVAVELLDAAETRRHEPNAAGQAGLLVPDEAITDPLILVRRLLAHCPDVRLRWPVERVEPNGAGTQVRGQAGTVHADYVINCAGLYADEVAADDTFRIVPRRGEFLVFGAGTSDLVNHILLPMPTASTKGVLVFPTLYGHLCAGPSAVDQDNKEDWTPRADQLQVIHSRAATLMPMLADMQPVDAWAGLRPAGHPNNYIVEWSGRVPTMLHVAGIRSTGLSACLGLGAYVLHLLADRGLSPAAPHTPVVASEAMPAAPWWQQLNTLRGVQAHVAGH
jgi:glycerol-3-phosphate dehydrogenase